MPTVQARMIKADQVARTRLQGTDVTAFVAIADKTRIREIGLRCLSGVFLADNVVYFTPEKCVLLVKQAVFAEIVRPRDDKATQGGADISDAHNPASLKLTSLPRIAALALSPDASNVPSANNALILRSVTHSSRLFFLAGLKPRPAPVRLPKAEKPRQKPGCFRRR